MATTERTDTGQAKAEVSRLLRSVANGMQTRRDHPSYGVRKTDLVQTLHVAEGTLRAIAFIEDRLPMLSLETAMVDRKGDDDRLYDLIAERIRLSAELRSLA